MRYCTALGAVKATAVENVLWKKNIQFRMQMILVL